MTVGGPWFIFKHVLTVMYVNASYSNKETAGAEFVECQLSWGSVIVFYSHGYLKFWCSCQCYTYVQLPNNCF